MREERKIIEIETCIVDLPTNRPHKLSMTTMMSQTMCLVFIKTSDGITGVGEATSIGGLSYCPETPTVVKQIIDEYIQPLLMGEYITNINSVMKKVKRQIKGNQLAKSGVETAIIDNYARSLNLSMSDVLGGSVTKSLGVLWTLASGDTVKDIDEAFELLEKRRHNIFKLKIGSNPIDKDIKHVCEIRKALGDKARLTVDINQAWSESMAKYGLPKLIDAGVDLIEQPVHRFDIEALARLNKMFSASFLADEVAQTSSDVFRIASMGASDAVALKIGKSGGPLQVLKSAYVAEAAGMSLYGGTLLEGTIGTVASLHAFSTLHMEWGTELFGPLLLTDDIVKQSLKYENFEVQIPNGPGLGIELDEEKVNFYKRKM